MRGGGEQSARGAVSRAGSGRQSLVRRLQRSGRAAETKAMKLRLTSASVLLIALSTTLAACGVQASHQQLAAASAAGRSQGAAQQQAEASKQAEAAKQRQLESDVAALKSKLAANSSSSASSVSSGSGGSGSSTGSGTRDCGLGVSVNSVTTCSFAQIVVEAWRQSGGGYASFQAWSPATQRFYLMRCSPGLTTICRGGNNAAVYIR
jgi:hypothetical protein